MSLWFWVWCVPNYFWFHPHTLEFEGFRWVEGQYQPIIPTPQGWLWSEQLELYLGIHEQKLGWFTEKGDLIPFPEQQERLAKEQAEYRVQELELLLRSQQQL